jgi:hypothetical protein
MPPYDLDFRPENLIPNILCKEHGTELSAEEKETMEGVEHGFDSFNNLELCRACGWNSCHETGSYLPRIHIEHIRPNGGMWTMGNDRIVWDRTGEECGNDYMTHQFLQKQGTKDIPLVKRMAEFPDEDDQHNFAVMSGARRIQLSCVWKGVSPEEKDSYVDRMVAALRGLRQFEAEFPQKVDGSPLWDNVIGNCNSRKNCIKVGKTAEDWFNNMDEELQEGISRELQTRDKNVIDTRLRQLKVCFVCPD